MTDLSKMTAQELHALAREAVALAERKKDQEKKDLRNELVEKIKSAGYTVDEIFPSSGSVKSTKTKSTPEVRYRDPQNPENTWSGRGRKARWLVEAEAAGRPLSDFEV